MLDAKWLDFLKQGFGTFLALTLAAGAILANDSYRWISIDLPSWVRTAVFIVGVASAFLAAVDFIKLLWRGAVFATLPIRKWSYRRRLVTNFRRDFKNLSGLEMYCFAWLVKNHKQYFAGDFDCCNGVTLVSKGYIVRTMLAGRHYSPMSVPFAVPDYIWAILQEHRDVFERIETSRFSPFNKFGRPE